MTLRLTSLSFVTWYRGLLYVLSRNKLFGNFYVYLTFVVFERMGEDTETEAPLIWLTSRITTVPRTEAGQSQDPEPRPGLLRVLQGPSVWSIIWYWLQALSRELDLKWSSWDINCCPCGCWSPRQLHHDSFTFLELTEDPEELEFL